MPCALNTNPKQTRCLSVGYANAHPARTVRQLTSTLRYSKLLA